MTTERRLLRRILVAFALVIVVTPPVLLGGAWSLLLVPGLVAAAVALHSALRLRRMTRSSRDDTQPNP